MKNILTLTLLLLSACVSYGQALSNGLQPQQTSQTPLSLRISDGDLSSILGTFKFGSQTVKLTPNATNFIYMDLTQNPPTITVNTSGFPSSQAFYAIATVVTNSTSIVSVADSRPSFNTTIGANSGGAVSSVFGRAGVVVPQSADYSFAQISGTLGHPQLPALVSGDIPNNAANTSGTAANLSGTPALPNGTTATTQSQADGSTKLATTNYVDTGLATKTPPTLQIGGTPTASQSLLNLVCGANVSCSDGGAGVWNVGLTGLANAPTTFSAAANKAICTYTQGSTLFTDCQPPMFIMAWCNSTIGATSNGIYALYPFGNSAGSTQYNNTSPIEMPMPIPCTFRNLSAQQNVAGLISTSGKVSLYIDGVITALTVTLGTTANTVIQDLSDSAAITAGHTFSIRASPVGQATDTTQTIRASVTCGS